MSEAKKQNYLHGAAIMVGTTVIVKIAAFFYKLPLGSMKLLGDEGFAHFMVAYNIYSFSSRWRPPGSRWRSRA